MLCVNVCALVFFLLTRRRPLSPTLFPYTTLFRSRYEMALTHTAPGHATVATGAWPSVHGVIAKDRKSTRLNSSHANISYSVFCLKKKNRLISQSIPHKCLAISLDTATRS